MVLKSWDLPSRKTQHRVPTAFLQAGVRDLHVGLDIFTASEDPPNPITGLRSTEETEGSSVISFQRNKGLGPTVVTF